MVKNSLDITFANEQEILSLIDSKNFKEVVSFGKNLKKLLVVTRGKKGSIAIKNDEVVEFGVQKNLLRKRNLLLFCLMILFCLKYQH